MGSRDSVRFFIGLEAGWAWGRSRCDGMDACAVVRRIFKVSFSQAVVDTANCWFKLRSVSVTPFVQASLSWVWLQDFFHKVRKLYISLCAKSSNLIAVSQLFLNSEFFERGQVKSVNVQPCLVP